MLTGVQKCVFFFSSRRRHTRFKCDWSSDVCSSDLASIPLLGKLFTSRSRARNNSELLVIVTPEVVRPIPAGQPLPSLKMPFPFLTKNSDIEMRTPGIDKTGPVPGKPPAHPIPVTLLIQRRKEGQRAPPATIQPFQLVPVPAAPPPVNPGLTPTPATGGAAQ